MGLLNKLFSAMGKNHRVITIDGEYGSGANELGANIAKKLNIKFYDEKTIELMSLESKVRPEEVRKDDSFLQGTIYDLYRENYSYSQEDMSVSDAAFLMDSRTIREIAKEGPCVIIGKCADYVLGQDHILSVFVYGDEELKKKRVQEEYQIKPEKVMAVMTKEDSRRSNHYGRNTGRVWGRSAEYDLSINSSKFQFSKLEDVIIDLYRSKK